MKTVHRIAILSLFLLVGCSRLIIEDGHRFSNLALNGDAIYFGAGYKLYRINLRQGDVKLLHDAKDLLITFVRLEGGNLFFGGHHTPRKGNGILFSYDLNTSEISWKLKVEDRWGSQIVVSPLIAGEILIIGTRTKLFGIYKANGEIKWKIENNWFGSGMTPILSRNKLLYEISNAYFGGNKAVSDRTIAISDPVSGETIRTLTTPGRLGGIPAIIENRLFVKDYQHYETDDVGKLHWIGDLRLNCLDLKSGEMLWTYHGNGVSAPSLMAFYGKKIYDVFANRLHAIDEQTGDLIWKSHRVEAAARNPQIIEELHVTAVEAPSAKTVSFMDLTTGEMRLKPLQDVLSSPLFIGHDVIYGTANAITRIDFSNDNLIWRTPVNSQYQYILDD